jgi:hypothetical protein
VLWLLSSSGCAPQNQPPPPPSSAQAPAEVTAKPDGGSEAEGEDHEHTAPHGGTLLELGDEFAHVELVLDPAAGSLTAYVLDGEAEQAVRIEQATLSVVIDVPPALASRPLTLTPRASVLTGERAGDASEFVFSHDALHGVQRLTGRLLTIRVRGQTFPDTSFTVEPPSAPAGSGG